MKRLHKLLSSAYNIMYPRYPDDIQKLRSIVELKHMHPLVIERLWEAYSETYAAGWLDVNDQSIAEFKDWLDQGIETN